MLLNPLNKNDIIILTYMQYPINISNNANLSLMLQEKENKLKEKQASDLLEYLFCYCLETWKLFVVFIERL